VSGGHAHALYLHGDSPLHRLPPETKLAAMLVSIVAIVVTPREAIWAFALYAAIAAALLTVARVPPRVFATRMVVAAPFVLFAVLLPFLGGGERVVVLGMDLSVEGLWAMWNVLAKATLGIAAATLLGATTPVPDILLALDRLHTPRVITAIAGFMVRYLDVIAAELRRMRIAMASRSYDPRWFWQARPYATAAGALFVRSYERGERVHRAMVARGYRGHMPRLDRYRATPAEWARALAVPAVIVAIATVALLVR
jgi:cobalt/nickel transport system permease protein